MSDRNRPTVFSRFPRLITNARPSFSTSRDWPQIRACPSPLNMSDHERATVSFNFACLTVSALTSFPTPRVWSWTRCRLFPLDISDHECAAIVPFHFACLITSALPLFFHLACLTISAPSSSFRQNLSDHEGVHLSFYCTCLITNVIGYHLFSLRVSDALRSFFTCLITNARLSVFTCRDVKSLWNRSGQKRNVGMLIKIN